MKVLFAFSPFHSMVVVARGGLDVADQFETYNPPLPAVENMIGLTQRESRIEVYGHVKVLLQSSASEQISVLV